MLAHKCGASGLNDCKRLVDGRTLYDGISSLILHDICRFGASPIIHYSYDRDIVHP